MRGAWQRSASPDTETIENELSVARNGYSPSFNPRWADDIPQPQVRDRSVTRCPRPAGRAYTLCHISGLHSFTMCVYLWFPDLPISGFLDFRAEPFLFSWVSIFLVSDFLISCVSWFLISWVSCFPEFWFMIYDVLFSWVCVFPDFCISFWKSSSQSAQKTFSNNVVR